MEKTILYPVMMKALFIGSSNYLETTKHEVLPQGKADVIAV